MSNGDYRESQDFREPVIVVGAGLSGLATALGVALRGRRAVVLEIAELVGGAAAYSGGQVWVGANHVAEREGISDDLERTARYVRGIQQDERGIRGTQQEYLDEQAMLRWLATAPKAARYWEDVGAIRWRLIPDLPDRYSEVDGALEQGRVLTNEVIDGSELGAWRERLRVSPYSPVGTVYVFQGGKHGQFEQRRRANEAETSLPEAVAPTGGSDPLTFGTGVVASFLARVAREPGIDIRTGHAVTEIIRDGDRVVGVLAQTQDGEREFRGPVVLATSSYDWDPELVRELLGLEPDDWGSVAPDTLRGDGLKLARAVGAATALIPANSAPIIPGGWPSQVGNGVRYATKYAMPHGEFALPHTMIVDSSGRRYCDDSYWHDVVAKTLAPNDRHLPFFLVWDDQHRQKYGLAGTPPGGDYPTDWPIASASTLAELGRKLGIDGEQLELTAARFSENARRGQDPDFGRGTVPYVNNFTGDPDNEPSPVLGPVERPPFHGLRLRFISTGISVSGISIDGDAHVLNESGGVIAGLYAVGSCAALTHAGTGYNSGFSLSRCITLAYLVSHELTGVPLP